MSLYRPDENGHNTFSNAYILSKDIVKLDIYNINDDVGFLLIQVHSFIESITLSESSRLSLHSYVTGTNIGLIWANNGSEATLYLLRNEKIGATVDIMLVINIYDENGKILLVSKMLLCYLHTLLITRKSFQNSTTTEKIYAIPMINETLSFFTKDITLKVSACFNLKK